MTAPQSSGSPRFVLTTDETFDGRDTAGDRERARRVRACLKACEGLSTEDLEEGIVADMCRVITLVSPMLEDGTIGGPAMRRAA